MTARTLYQVSLPTIDVMQRVITVSNFFLDPRFKKTDPLTPYTFTPGEGFNFSATVIDADGPVPEASRFLRYTRTDNTAGVVQPAGHSPQLLIGRASNRLNGFGAHRVDVHVRSNHTVPWTIQIRYYDAAGVQVGVTESATLPTVNAGVWSRLSKNLNIDGSIASIDIVVWASETQVWAIGDTFDVAGAMITEGTVAQPFSDGDTTGWYWTGTKYASPSGGDYIVNI